MQISDEELVRRSQENDRVAFAELVDRHKAKVLNLAYRMVGNAVDAEDMASEVFIRVFENIKKFRFRSQFTTWLYRAATNVCLNYLERHNKDKMLQQFNHDKLRVANQASGIEEEMEQRELQEIVRRAILELPVKYRIVITLHHLQGFTYEEIAKTLLMPIGTVKTQLFRAKEILKDKLKAYMGVKEDEL